MSEILKSRVGWRIFLGLLVALFVVAWFAGDVLKAIFGTTPPLTGGQVTWLVGLVTVSAGVLVAGTAINGRWSGVLIDSRNRYSLAQVQAVMWLVIVSSAIVAAGVDNVRRGDPTPLDLAIPGELLAVIGLSVTTVVGTPLIRSLKRDNTPDKDQAERTIGKLGVDRTMTTGVQVFGFDAGGNAGPAVTSEGTIVTFADPNRTGWVDLVRGEETGNADKVDLGKLQLLYISSVAVFVYCASLFSALAPVAEAGQVAHIAFPAIDASFVGILGLSHAGALAYLAAPHAKTS